MMIKNFSFFVFVVIISIIGFKIGQWRTWRAEEILETKFITDTLEYKTPEYVTKPSLFFRLFHKSIPPRSIQPIAYKPWMDSIFTAINFIKKGSIVQTIMKRGKIAHKFTIYNVPDDYEFYGTPVGYNIIKKRFKNPFGWKGLLIGFEFYDLSREINPYVETGISLKNINIIIGIDKNSLKEKIPVYTDVSYKIL